MYHFYLLCVAFWKQPIFIYQHIIFNNNANVSSEHEKKEQIKRKINCYATVFIVLLDL